MKFGILKKRLEASQAGPYLRHFAYKNKELFCFDRYQKIALVFTPKGWVEAKYNSSIEGSNDIGAEEVYALGVPNPESAFDAIIKRRAKDEEERMEAIIEMTPRRVLGWIPDIDEGKRCFVCEERPMDEQEIAAVIREIRTCGYRFSAPYLERELTAFIPVFDDYRYHPTSTYFCLDCLARANHDYRLFASAAYDDEDSVPEDKINVPDFFKQQQGEPITIELDDDDYSKLTRLFQQQKQCVWWRFEIEPSHPMWIEDVLFFKHAGIVHRLGAIGFYHFHEKVEMDEFLDNADFEPAYDPNDVPESGPSFFIGLVDANDL